MPHARNGGTSMSSRSRPSWDEIRMAMARELAKRSLCDRDQVGAIIVDAGQKVIGEGYNGPPRNFEHGEKSCVNWCRRAGTADWHENSEAAADLPEFCHPYEPSPRGDYSDCPSLHAEANALVMSDRSLRAGGIMYVTSHPCFPCAKLIANSGLMGLYVHADNQHEYRNDAAVYKFLTDLGMLVRIVR